MSSYTAIICCEKCGKELSKIEAYHKPKSDWFVPQDIMEQKFALPSMFCQDCLNAPIKGGNQNE